MAQRVWTHEALARLAQKVFVLGVASVGLAVVGAALFGLAVWGESFDTYRGQYLAAGGGLALATVFGITLANLSILKTGKAKAIRFSTLESICSALDCQPGDLLSFKAQGT